MLFCSTGVVQPLDVSWTVAGGYHSVWGSPNHVNSSIPLDCEDLGPVHKPLRRRRVQGKDDQRTEQMALQNLTIPGSNGEKVLYPNTENLKSSIIMYYYYNVRVMYQYSLHVPFGQNGHANSQCLII